MSFVKPVTVKTKQRFEPADTIKSSPVAGLPLSGSWTVLDHKLVGFDLDFDPRPWPSLCHVLDSSASSLFQSRFHQPKIRIY